MGILLYFTTWFHFFIFILTLSVHMEEETFIGDCIYKQKWWIWEKSAQRCTGRPGHVLGQLGACACWEKEGGKQGDFYVMETEGRDYTRWWQQSIRWDSPTGSRKVRVEQCPLEISVTLGRAVCEGWWEEEQDCRVKRRECNVWACSDKSSLSLGLCSQSLPFISLTGPQGGSFHGTPTFACSLVCQCLLKLAQDWMQHPK